MEAIYFETIGCTIAYDELGRVCIVPADTHERVHLHMAESEGGEGDRKSGERKNLKTHGRTNERRNSRKVPEGKKRISIVTGLTFLPVKKYVPLCQKEVFLGKREKKRKMNVAWHDERHSRCATSFPRTEIKNL